MIRSTEFDQDRRRVFRLAAGSILAVATGRARAEDADGLRIGLTPVFLDDQVAFLNEWRAYLGARIGRPVAFVQRGSYREVVDLLRQGSLEFAWLCGYPFVRYRRQMRLATVPLFRGKPLYQSYLIVPAKDPVTRSLVDLRGKVFAYSDPDSNSGYLYPQFLLLRSGEKPATFFRRSFFTWGHRKVVEAVAAGLAQAGAVDGYVWETLNLTHPALTAQTRIIQRSPDFGFPPVVARADLPEAGVEALRGVLLAMPADAAGVALLRRLNLDGFAPADPALFDGIAEMMRVVETSLAPAP